MAIKCALLLALVAGAFAGPLSNRQSSTCASTCPEASKFSWKVGKTYEYQYESDIKTHIAGASEEHSSLHIRATALIEVLAPCEMALRLSDVSIQDSSPDQYESRQHVEESLTFKRELQERPLRFAFLDGRVEAVCAEQGDETWVLNIKKGIVSAFQNTQTRLDVNAVTVESDVAGTCPVEYEVSGSSAGTKTIKKTKDLLGCTERLGHLTAFQATPYRIESAIQSLPLMKSTHECTQQIKNGILSTSSCSELHILRPFSKGNSGAVTEVTYKLNLYRENDGTTVRQGSVNRRTSLIFEHIVNTEEMLSTSRDAKQTLTKLCSSSQNEITPEVPSLFNELVHQLRRLDTRTLKEFYNSAASSCTKASKFVRDTVPVIGTTASVTLMRDIVLNQQVGETEAEVWLTSMSFIASPSKDMLREVKPLLASGKHLRKSVLAVSTLVHSYCRDNSACVNEPEVTDIIRMLEDNLHYNCKSQSNEQHDLILMSLKGLGNTGHARQVAPTLNRCFKNNELPVEIRVAALQAFRRMTCSVDMSEIRDILTNNLEDSELRIHAYLTLMQCPTADSLRYVQDILAKEEINQVGSFIWTHLTNLMETSNPHKQDIRNILESAALQKRFDMDKRKFSRNLEWSAFSQLINAGGMVESNLIWSEKSFVPRSASLNLTVDMFGESVNLMEIGARVQGLEKTLETLFAEEDNNVERQKRSTGALANIDRTYDLKRDAAQASYFIRIFGNEIHYDDLHDFDLANIKDKLNFLDFLIELSKEQKFEMTRTIMFLDTTTTIPTAAGLPLKLSVDGTTSVNVNVNGKLDVRQMLSSLSTFDIDGTIKPSASMEINGEMGVDAHIARTGVKMQTTLHTSTVATGKIQMQDGKIFKLDIKTPQDNTQVLNANNKFYIKYRSEQREQKMLSTNKIEKSGCTSDKFATITGLEFCGQVSLPWSRGNSDAPCAAFWGPSSASITLSKKDTHNSYVAEVKYVKEKARRNGVFALTDVAKFYVNTPGSSVNRQILAEFSLDRSERQLKFNLDTPWKKATFDAGLTNTAELKKVFSTATIDGKTEFSVDAEVAIDAKSYVVQYTPKVEVSIPGMNKIVLNGDLKHRPGKKGVFDLALKNVFEEPIKVSGTIMGINEPKQLRYETDIDFTSHLLNGKVATFVDKSKDQSTKIESKFDLEYTYKDQPKQLIKFEETFVDESDLNSFGYKVDGTWSSTFLPRYNGDVHMESSFDSGNLKVTVNSGFDSNRRITFSEVATFRFAGDQELDIEQSLQIPTENIDYKGKLSYKKNKDELKVSATGKCSAKEANFELSLKRTSNKPLNVEGLARLTYPGRDMSINGAVKERAVNIYEQNLNIQLDKYQAFKINSVYKMQDMHDIETNIIIPETPKITIKAQVKPDIKNMQASGELTFGSSTYLASTMWTHRGSSTNFNTRASLDVAYPERKITASGTAIRKNSEITSTFETKWDANNDQSKKFSFSSKTNIEKTTPAFEIQMNLYPRTFVNLKTGGKYETQGWYRSDADVQGSFSLQSSFRNFEDINAAFVHDRTPAKYSNSAEVSWNRNKKITGKVDIKKGGDWSESEITAEISTPFRGATSVSTDISYSLKDTTFTTSARTNIEGQIIQLGFTGELNIPQHVLNGEITFTSPFRNYEELSATLHHNDNGESCQSNILMSWSRNKQIKVDLIMQNSGSMVAADNNGELSISTPFIEFQQAKINWQHHHNSDKMTNIAQIERDGKSVYNHNTAINIKKTNKKMMFDVQASIKPYTSNEISLTLDYMHDRQNFESLKTDASITWAPSRTISVSTDVDMSNNKILDAKVALTTPFSGFESISLTTKTKKESSTRVTSLSEFQWDTKKKINLVCDVTANGYELRGNAKFTSPFEKASQLVANVLNQQQDGIWVSHADLDYGKKIELDTEFSMGWKKIFSMRFISPCPAMKNAYVKAEINGNVRDFTYTVEVNHEKLKKKIELRGIAKTENIKDIKLTADLITPFEAIKSLKAIINYKKEGDSIHIDSMINHPQYKGKLNQDISFRSGRFMNTNTMIEYVEGKKVELITDLRMEPKISGKLTWRSPFEKFEEINVLLDHEGVMEDFVSSTEISYSPTDKINAHLNFKLLGNALNNRFLLSTPFSKINRFVFVINHEGPLRACKNDWSLELNDRRVSGKSEFNHNGDSVNLKAEIQTPYEGYETTTLELSHNGPANNFNNNFMVTAGNQQLSGSSQLRIRQSDLSASIALQMPFKSLSRLSIDVDHSGQWKDIDNKVVIVYNSDKIVSKANFKLTERNLNGKWIVKTPFSAARSLSAEINHEGQASNFKNSAVLSLNNKNIKGNSEFSLSENTMAIKATLDLPIEEYKRLSMEATHTGPANNFNNNVILLCNNRQIAGSSQFSLRGNTVSGKANIEIPKLTLTAEFSHDGEPTNFNNNGIVRYNGIVISGNSQVKLTPNKLTSKVNFASPWTNLAGEISHRGQAYNFQNSALFKYDEKEVKAASELNLNGLTLTTKASFECPGFNMKGELNHNGDSNAFSNNANFDVNGHTLTASSEHTLRGNILLSKATITAPSFTGLLELSHDGPSDNFKNYGLLTLNRDTYKAQSEYNSNGNGLNGKLAVTYPSGTSSALFNHRGKMTNFNNDIQLVHGSTKISGDSKFKLSDNSMTAEASIDIPKYKISAVVSHEGPSDNFKNSMNLNYNGQTVNGESEFSRGPNSVILKGSLSTPASILRSASLEVNHNGDLMNFKNSGLFSYNGNSISGSSSFANTDDNTNGKVTLSTPENRMAIEMDHLGQFPNFNSKGKATYNGKELSGDVMVSYQNNKLNTKGALNIPGKTVSYEINHEGSIGNFRNDAKFMYGREEVSGNTEFSLRNNRLNIKGQLRLPIADYRNIALEVTHNGPALNFQNLAKLTIGVNTIEGSTTFKKQGTTITGQANLQTTYGMEPIIINIQHSGPMTKFSNTATVSYGTKKASGSSEFSLSGNDLDIKVGLQTTFCCMEPVNVEISHKGPGTNFENRVSATYGSYNIDLNSAFKLRQDTLKLKSGFDTNIGNVKPFTMELNHSGSKTEFSNNFLISYGDDNVSGTTEFSLQNDIMHLKATADTSFGRIKPIVIDITHKGTINNFSDDLIFSYGNKEITSSSSFEINTTDISANLKLETPFREVERVIAKINHSGKNWRNFENSAMLKFNDEKYTGQSELRWFGKIFKLSAEVNIPDEYSLKINHKGTTEDFSNNLRIKIPGDKISGISSFKMGNGKIEGQASLESTIRNLKNFDISFNHDGTPKNFATSFSAKTPFPQFKSISGELKHKGDLAKFETTGKIELPFSNLNSLSISLNSEYSDDSLNSGAALTYNGKTASGNVNFKKTPRKVMAVTTIQTPYAGYENFGASMEYSGNARNFKTSGVLTSSIPGYERFSGSITHNDDMNSFNTAGEITTAIAKYSKFTFTVSHNGDRRNFKSSGTVTTSLPGYEKFAGSSEFSINSRTLHAAASMQTPFRGYEEFGVNLDHSGDINSFETTVGLTTSIRNYRNFGIKVIYNGNMDNFRTSIECTSSVRGYDKFTVVVEKKGSWKDFEISANIQTPLSRYENFGVSLKHTGRLNNFRTTGLLTTSIPGYDKFSGSVSHNGNLDSFTTNGQVQTPIRGHETYQMNINHDMSNGIASSASVEYPGKKYDFSLNHRGNMDSFNSDIQINTPHPGYEKIGMSMSHSGDINSGIITLPFRDLPEIKYRVSYRGTLRDFTCSASAEYNRQKITIDGNFKTSGDKREGQLALTTPYNILRDLTITGSHICTKTLKTIVLDITQNGRKSVDLDFEWQSREAQSVTLRVRQPKPIETSINFNGNGLTFTGDASVKYESFSANGDFSFKNVAGHREIVLNAVLPTRTIAVNSGYTMTDTSLTHKSNVQWGNTEAEKLEYTLDISKVNGRNQNTMTGRFNIRSARVTGEISTNIVYSPGRQYTGEFVVQSSKRIAVTGDMTINGPKSVITLTMEHPKLSKGLKIKVESMINEQEYNGKVDVQFNKQQMTFTGRIADVSSRGSYNYVTSCAIAHPASGLDLQFSSNVQDNAQKNSVVLEAKYLSAIDRKYKIGTFKSELDKSRKELSIEMSNPLDTIRLSGRQVSASNGVYKYTGEASCLHTTVRSELSIVKAKSADLKIYYKDSDYMQVSAKATPELVSAEIWRMVSGKKIREVEIMLQKDEERVITGKSYLCPNMYTDFKDALQTTSFGKQLKQNIQTITTAVKQEYEIKMEYIKTVCKPLYDVIMAVKEDIEATAQIIKADLKDMYNENMFHLKDICEWIKTAKSWIRSKYYEVSRTASANYTNAKSVAMQVQSNLPSLDDVWELAQKKATDFQEWMDSFDFSQMRDQVQENTRDFYDRVRNHPTMQKIVSRVKNTNVYSTVSTYVSNSQDSARATSGSAPSIWDQLFARDDVQTGISYVKTQVKNSELATKYNQLKQTFDNIMSDFRQNGLKTVRENVGAWMKNYLKTDKDRFTIGDNDIEFTLYIPLPLSDLRSLPKIDINLSQYLRQAKNLYNNIIPKNTWTFNDYYYNYKPSGDIKSLIPPFAAHATIAGNQHFMTFDKNFYEFAGECSYVLARDFIEGSFGVIVDYERIQGRPTKKSLTVMSGDHTIVISADGRVVMDGSRIEMPVQMERTSVVREDNEIYIKNKNGITVVCDLVHDRCTVEVSGWYYGKTAGLFGTYNNEQLDDLTTNDRRREQDLARFASSWAVGSRCRATNSAIDVSNEVYPENERYRVCAKYFKEKSSPFNRCFNVIKPEPFMKMCLNDLPTGRVEREEDTCNISSFYVSECMKKYVPVKIPSMCVTCKTENGQIFSEGQNVTLENDQVPNTADIVFVIHHSDCNKMMLDNLKNIVDDLEGVLKTENLVNNKYAIVGYGGEGVTADAHIHTMDGQIFATRDKILLGLENFHTKSGDSEDAMYAVKYAANLPFRVGVSKNIILLPCAACKQGKASFSELQQILLFRDINFHVLMQYNFLFKGNKDAGTAYIFGVDRETVYTRKDAGTTELVGDSEIRSQILMPKDLCVALSEETDGSVFNTLQFINNRPFIQKRFTDVLVRVIADKAEPSDCQICQCTADIVGAGKADCRHCVRPDPIYNLMPRSEELLPPTKVQDVTEIKKGTKGKTQRELNAKKRQMRARRLQR